MPIPSAAAIDQLGGAGGGRHPRAGRGPHGHARHWQRLRARAAHRRVRAAAAHAPLQPADIRAHHPPAAHQRRRHAHVGAEGLAHHPAPHRSVVCHHDGSPHQRRRAPRQLVAVAAAPPGPRAAPHCVRIRACVPTGACASACRMRACARDAALNLAHGQAALSPKFGYCFDGLILANMVLLSLQSADVYQEDDALHLSIGPIGMLFALGSSRCATHACITPPHARCLRVPGDVDTRARG